MADKVLDIISDALYEIGVYGPDDLVPSAADAQLCFRLLNRELDSMAARQAFVYAMQFVEYTLTPGTQPTLIGPGLTAPNFAAAQRPVRIEGAALVLNNVTPNVDSPIINIRDATWWKNQQVKPLLTNVPTDLYYEPDFPNGSLFFWPVPNFAYGVRLEIWGLISQFASIAATFNLPPGYKKALVLTLALRACRAFGVPVPPSLPGDVRDAWKAVQSNNVKSPRIASADYGATGSRRGGSSRPTFNYYVGQ